MWSKRIKQLRVKQVNGWAKSRMLNCFEDENNTLDIDPF